jgi:D-beta-D-heptose 7-phosphate kinase/D-beta-D-heptose 1-phosphate adenosyltransferase
MNRIVLCTGGFDPVHSGHISYFKEAKSLGDYLIVGLNSDEWLERKKGRAFMPWNERLCVVNNLSMVDEVYTFDDEDGSARHFIQQVRAHYPNSELIFANGGDRTKDNIPEMNVKDSNLKFVFGVGGNDKKNSSSSILENWDKSKTSRPWGYWRVLYQDGNTKVKELVVEPGQSLSMQKHSFRNEYWHVVEGVATVRLEYPKEEIRTSTIFKNHHFSIPLGVWHQLINNGEELLKIIEIQHGEKCEENDIERKLIFEMPGTLGSAKIIFGERN